MKPIADSELILNPDGSIYHLHLLPEDIAETIITVGDPNRVKMVSSFFDSIEVKKEKREFFTHTGRFGDKRITVISTGIGTDNIDIVFNELDALVNIDFENRVIKKNKTALNIIRIGTSGCLDENIPVDATLLSTHGFGFDGLLNFYDYLLSDEEQEFLNQIDLAGDFKEFSLQPSFISGSTSLIDKFFESDNYKGITATCAGFYGPQGRILRLKPKIDQFLDRLTAIRWRDLRVTNFEMETSGIYGLSRLLGHQAISINLLIANRARGEFSENPKESMKKMIEWTLNKI